MQRFRLRLPALPNGALCLSVFKHGRQSLSPRNPHSRPQLGFRKIASVEEMHCNSCLPLPYFFSSALSKGKGACLRHILQRGGGAFRTKQDLSHVAASNWVCSCVKFASFTEPSRLTCGCISRPEQGTVACSSSRAPLLFKTHP